VFVCRQSPDGEILYGNNAFVRFFGNFRAKSSQDFYELLDERDRNKVALEISKINFDSPVTHFEARVLGDQKERWVRWIQRGIFNELHQLIEYQSVGFDVTEVHNKTSDLLAKESLYTNVLEYTSDYLSVYRFE